MPDHVVELVTIEGVRVRVTEGDAMRAIGEGLARRHPEIMASGSAATCVLLPLGMTATLSIAPIEAKG